MTTQESVSSGTKSAISEGDINKIEYSGDADEYVTIGKTKYHRHELMLAFGGSLNPGVHPQPKYDINPAPVGLAAFSLSVFVLSLYNVQAFGITVPNVIIGLSCFYGGVVQFLSGVALLFANNTYAATALASFGCFWMSFATLYIPAFGVIAAYEDAPDQLATGIGFFLTGWCIFSFIMWTLTWKSTVAFSALFLNLVILFAVLAAGAFTGNVTTTRAGGGLGIMSAFLGWYNCFAGVANPQNSYFNIHPINLPGNLI